MRLLSEIYDVYLGGAPGGAGGLAPVYPVCACVVGDPGVDEGEHTGGASGGPPRGHTAA